MGDRSGASSARAGRCSERRSKGEDMNAFVLIAAILQTLALVARNPSIGFDATRYADLLEFLGRLVQRGNAAVDELKLLRTEVEGIIEQGRAPSEDEIA